MPRQEGWVWEPLALTRERETVAKAFTVISMGVCTLIKKKKRIMCFIGKMILFEKSRKLRLGRANYGEAHASPENRGGGVKGGDCGGRGVGHWLRAVGGSCCGVKGKPCFLPSL